MASMEVELIVERLRAIADEMDCSGSMSPSDDAYGSGYSNGQAVAYTFCAGKLRDYIDELAPPPPKNRKPKKARRR